MVFINPSFALVVGTVSTLATSASAAALPLSRRSPSPALLEIGKVDGRRDHNVVAVEADLFQTPRSARLPRSKKLRARALQRSAVFRLHPGRSNELIYVVADAPPITSTNTLKVYTPLTGATTRMESGSPRAMTPITPSTTTTTTDIPTSMAMAMGIPHLSLSPSPPSRRVDILTLGFRTSE